jgi:lipopolysaccharide transport system ATP-binding protein
MAAIEVQHVSKTYRIPHERHTTLAERLLSLFRPLPVDMLQALSDVSLQIPAGRFVGIIGANGSGKSTLLKVVAGLLEPDAGRVEVHGSLVPLLELGLGFHSELTVRENVLLYGAVLGYPRAQLEACADEAIAFAGLERFRDAKLKSLSSGMLVRLGFSTALQANADILLLDEVLAVGDAQFQRKCLDVFTDLKRQRRTIVLVSHDVGAVQRFCDTVFWLDKGRLVMAGDASEVIQTYLALMTSPIDPPRLEADSSEHRHGDGRVRFVGARLEDEAGRPLTRARAGGRLVLRLEVAAYEPCDPVFGFILWRAGNVVYSTNTELLGVRVGGLAPGDRCVLGMSFVAGLADGQYSVSVAAADRSGLTHDWVNHLLTLVVEGSRCGDGVADLATECRWEVTSRQVDDTRATPP